VAVLAALPALLGASPALAQPTVVTAPAEPTASPAVADDGLLAGARVAFHNGTELARQARWVEALQAFERSDALHPHAITTYNIGYCERLLGHSTRARKMLAKALADHHARGNVELPAELVSAAQAYLGRVRVTITPGAVAVDGRPLELAANEGPRPVLLAGTRAVGQPEVPPSFTFEVLLDPGTHVFVLSVSGRPDVVANETLAPGSQISLELHLPEATEGAKPVGQSDAGASPADKPNRVPAFVAFGIGAGGLAVGTVGGLVALGKKGAVRTACEGTDASACTRERNAGNLAADISTGSFIAGGVAAGVGAALFFAATGGKSGKPVGTLAPRGTDVRPVVGWGTLGLEGRF
jgi:hypothetical protein